MRAVVVLFTLLAVAACGGPADLPREFGRTVRKVGLFPVYPPREEFQLGDIYLWSMSRTDPNDSVSIYVGTMDWLRGEAEKFMSTRIVFENTPLTNDGTAARAEHDIPEHGLVLRANEPAIQLATRKMLGWDGLARSLPIAAFPKVTADAGFTAGIGIVRLLTAFGLAGGERTQVELNFNDVRTYWVPNVLVQNRVEDELAQIFGSPLMDDAYDELERAAAAKLGPNVPPCDGLRTCGLSAITRVYLTRRIDYTYRNARIIAGALRQAEQGVRRSDVPVAPAVALNIGNIQTGEVSGSAIDGERAALREQLDQLTASENQGASLRFEAWDARGMTFASQYMRPVVVGWDGISRPF